MSAFVSELVLSTLTSSDGVPLKSPADKQLFVLIKPFIYESDLLGLTLTVPEGFITDLASVPRLPLIYLLLNESANMPGVIHDYLYSVNLVNRKTADKILREACYVIGLPAWQTELIYTGVRVGGASRYLNIKTYTI